MAALLLLVLALAGCTPSGPAAAPMVSPIVILTPSEISQQPTSTVPPTLAWASSVTAVPLATVTLSPTLLPATRPPATLIPAAATTFTPTPTLASGTLILSFTASPAEINPGESFTLTWNTSGKKAVLCPMTPDGQMGVCSDVPPVGSQQVLTSPQIRNFVSYLLFAYQGESDDSPLESASVTVRVRCVDTWFFPNPPGSCPKTSVLVTPAVAQRFERGLMIWLQANRMIFVLFSGGSSPAYDVVWDQWQAGMPESDPNVVPPAGLYQPVRGFGLVWRGESPIGAIRDRIGWATAAEFSFNSAFQCDSAFAHSTCYLQGPDGVIVIEPERSGWYIWSGPTPGP